MLPIFIFIDKYISYSGGQDLNLYHVGYDPSKLPLLHPQFFNIKITELFNCLSIIPTILFVVFIALIHSEYLVRYVLDFIELSNKLSIGLEPITNYLEGNCSTN